MDKFGRGLFYGTPAALSLLELSDGVAMDAWDCSAES